MTDFQKKYCLRMLDKIEKHPISELFRDKPSAIDDRYSTSLIEPEKYMDLKIVRKKLEEGQYKCINDWGSDVRMIWKNAQDNYPDSAISLMAADLSRWFEKRWGEYPRTEEEQWAKKLKKVEASVRNLTSKFPIDKSFLPEKQQ